MGRLRTPHSATYKGKRVFIKLRDGQEFVDKFVEKKGKFCVFQERGRIRVMDIRTFAINDWKHGR